MANGGKLRLDQPFRLLWQKRPVRKATSTGALG